MNRQLQRKNPKNRSAISLLASVVLLAATLFAHPVSAITYISAEPIPSQEIVGQDGLEKILNIGYPNLELWSNRLVNECHIVQNTIKALSTNGAISTVHSGNTRFLVAAGGFEAITDPSYVFTIQDSGMGAASWSDVGVLSNALGSREGDAVD
jgi:hypothetical protein